ETYTGTHHYNQFDSRARRARPREEWISISVPEVIPRKTFERAQALLYARRPTVTAPRVTNSEVLLTGLLKCENCGESLMIRTGKGGRYRYYACSAERLKGKASCGKPISIPEAQLDELIVGALADNLLTPDRVIELHRQAQAHRRALSAGNVGRRTDLRKRRK